MIAEHTSPGREMDALVHQVIHDREVGIEYCRYVDGDYHVSMGYPLGHDPPPNYSTDDEVAVVAFKWMYERGVVTISASEGEFNCDWIPTARGYKTAFVRTMNGFRCQSLAHAICTALLIGAGALRVIAK